MPNNPATAMMCQIWIRPVKIRKPTTTASAICTTWVQMRILRLSKRSAADPPSMVRKIIGKPAAKLTIPSMIALFVRVLMTQPWAMICIQVPVSEMEVPIM